MINLLELLATLNILWVITTIISGLVVGITFNRLVITRESFISLLIVSSSFVIPRILIFVLFGQQIAAGSGFVGGMLYMIFLISIFIGRRVGKKFKGA